MKSKLLILLFNTPQTMTLTFFPSLKPFTYFIYALLCKRQTRLLLLHEYPQCLSSSESLLMIPLFEMSSPTSNSVPCFCTLIRKNLSSLCFESLDMQSSIYNSLFLKLLIITCNKICVPTLASRSKDKIYIQIVMTEQVP